MGVSGQQYHAPAALYPRGKDPRYPLELKGKIENKYQTKYLEDNNENI
jgi:hypothetical protein